MRKTIADVVNFPNGCETVKFTACFVSMLMRAEGLTDENQEFFCGRQMGPCNRCGKCDLSDPLIKLHNELYNLYTMVTGYGFLQIDLSDDEHMNCDWELTCQKLLRQFDYYVGFTMDFAGYAFCEVQAPESRESILGKIRASIDADKPVLMQLTRQYQWILVTGYDEEGTLYGFDGSKGYWGKSPAQPRGYEDGLFILSDWYEKMAHAFILGEKKQPAKTLEDVFRRGVKIMESMEQKGYYRNSVAFMEKDEYFEQLSDEALLDMRDRIARWIGQPIDQRAMMGYGLNPLRAGQGAEKQLQAFHDSHRLCCVMHDVLWIAWRAVGEFMGGDKLEWAKGLRNKTIRRAIADCLRFVQEHDAYLFQSLKRAFD